MKMEDLGISDDSDEPNNESLFMRPSAVSALSIDQENENHPKKKLKFCVTEWSYAIKTISKHLFESHIPEENPSEEDEELSYRERGNTLLSYIPMFETAVEKV